ncbi:MAG: hypothetical protein GOV01_00640 [Candidatus Altiarchaeota archaeon]|nr:hypothetical protein [Candidatus Altiarchaeota archaeon]
MIVEVAILSLCLYGLMKEGDVLKVAAIVSLISFPAVMLFTRAGAENLVLLVLVIEAVPFAFSLLILKIAGVRNYRVMWK